MPQKCAKQVSSLWNQYRKFNDRFYFKLLAQLSICFRRPARKGLSIIYCISPSPITLNRSWEVLNDFLKDFLNDFHNKFLIFQFLRLSLTQKALHLPFYFFFLFFLLANFSGWAAKSYLFNFLSCVIKKACDQDLTYSLDTLNSLSVKSVSQVVIRDACGTWHSLCTVTSIYSI